MAKRKIAWRLNGDLLDRLEALSRKDNVRQIILIEQALAEFLNIPLADRRLPQQTLELCAQCERGVMNEGRCGHCGWHRLTRQEQWAKERADRQARAREEYLQKIRKRSTA